MAYIPNSGKGTPDASLYFCTAQAIPTDGADDLSENVIDLIDTAPDIRGTPYKLKVKITTLVAVASGTSSKMYINLLTDAAATTTIAGGWATVQSAVLTLGYNDAKGKVYEGMIVQKGPVAYERYLALSLEPVNDDTLYSAGAIDAWLEPA